MREAPSHALAGAPGPLGAHSDGRGTNFAVFAEHAEHVQLCLFDPSGRQELRRVVLPECTDGVWHCYLPEARPGLLYGYRVHGPYDPANGNRFNHHKLLLDPYAKQIVGDLRWNDSHFGYRIGHRQEDLSFDRRDNAPGMLKAMVVGLHVRGEARLRFVLDPKSLRVERVGNPT